MSDNPIDPKLLKDLPSVFEKITEFRFLCLFIAFSFALDNALVYFAHKNLLALSTNSPEITIGNAIVFVGVFSFLLSACFPFFRTVIRIGFDTLLRSFLCQIAAHFERPTTYNNPAIKSIFAVESKALLEQNEFDLKLVAQYREKQRENERESERNFNLIFGMTILFACNLWTFGDQNVPTISQVFASLLDQPMGFGVYPTLKAIYGAFFLLTFGMSLYGIWPFLSQDEKIYLPRPEDHAPKVAEVPKPSYPRKDPDTERVRREHTLRTFRNAGRRGD